MPHLLIEYSANLEPKLDIPPLVRVIHEAALETGFFPIGGIRTRAQRDGHYHVADGHNENEFIHIQARFGAGRTPEVRRQAAERIFCTSQVRDRQRIRRNPARSVLGDR
jgi:5-carboxymethyl-2-hydroxymuconate isomerase